MLRKTTVSITILILALTSFASAESWDEHTINGEWSFATGNFERAESEFRAALTIAQGLPQGNRKLETSLENLGRFYEHRSRYDEAQPMYQLLLAAQEFRLGTEDPQLLSALVAVARVCLARGDVLTGDENLRRYITIADASGKANPSEFAQILGLLSRSLSHQEQTDEALSLARRSVAMMVDDNSLDDVVIANAMESLAQLELLNGSARAAEQLLVDSIKRRVSAGESVDISFTLASAAQTAFSSGSLESAEKLAQSAISAGGNGVDLAGKVLVDVAWFNIRRSAESITDILGVAVDDPTVRDAIKIFESRLSALQAAPARDQPQIDELQQRLLLAHAMHGDFDETIKMQQEVARKTDSPSTRIAATKDLVALLIAGDRKSEACDINNVLITEIEAASGPNSRELLAPLELQLELLTELKRKKETKIVKKQIKKLQKALK